MEGFRGLALGGGGEGVAVLLCGGLVVHGMCVKVVIILRFIDNRVN
jgi:hypothetical protein